MNFSQNELLQMIQMDKDVITSIINHLKNTTVVNGYNEGQLVEARLEIDRLAVRILDKASRIDTSFMQEQRVYLNTVLENLKGEEVVV